ncbi:hypothetical protein : Uncharacterized protein OS=Pirellula staleyi (strain ATCC 27377 / DSM 6068 / ICPB 4128) GN=Psta_0911 PE=4 SV=1 [Gemmataceae bacterium]|nr:hypothetical protein : Uncharacterized protein OS=Pirellula staleyi (strain ATCC 27377 / DSM 6068 / ICPB 4128) GN=Psta_0911 PE=4 SV=1 [Gemmataceae bacterium]VTT96576.1 hypothetical protein : Uncharacterized protein OS=Pirellula staleyi (strain ATCC 27377 / DSM 6068 / ICPB 4128) GN=Psta_0911 PE=4 SV=1 [Gemmataceae bacterium]
MPPMSGMFEPWLEKRGRNGAVHIRRGWFRKCAYRGGVLYHPDGTTNMGTEESPDVRNNQDIARETLEYSESGAVFTFTNEINGGKDGTYAWDYHPPEAQPDVQGVREYPQDLDAEMLEGAGIPPEVLEAADVGSGWSGRLIPLMGFLGGVDELAGLIIEAADAGWLRHLVAVNFGPAAWYEVEPRSLVDEVQEQAQGGEDGGEGENPIPGLFGRQDAGQQQPRQMSWAAYTGAHGGRGWKNGVTGEVRYQEAKPSDDGDDAGGPADEHAGKVRQILRTFKNLPKRAVKKARTKVTDTYRKLEQRYGPGYARLIVGVGVASLPVPIPGAAVAFAAPLLAVAELHKRLAKWNAAPPANVDLEGVVKLAARSFLAEVFGRARRALHLSTLDAAPPAVSPAAAVWVPTARVTADPARFQFRTGHDAADGTVRELPAEPFDPEKAEPLALWVDPADGLEYVVDGHHRLAWAERDGVKRVRARYVTAATAEDAKRVGEELNRKRPPHPKAVEMSATGDPGGGPHPHAEELALAMALAADQGDAEALGTIRDLAGDDDALGALLDELDEADGRELSWVAAQTRTGKLKAVGAGPHAGKTLYGKRAEAALRTRGPEKGPTAAGRRKAEAAERAKGKTDARAAGDAAAKRAVTDPKTLTAADLEALPAHLASLTKLQLTEFLRQVKGKVSGSKAELAARLLEYARTGAAAAKKPKKLAGKALQARARELGVPEHDLLRMARTGELAGYVEKVTAAREGLAKIAADAPAPTPQVLKQIVTLAATAHGPAAPAHAARHVADLIARHATDAGRVRVHGMARPEDHAQVAVGGIAFKFAKTPEARAAVAKTLVAVATSGMPAALWKANKAVVFTGQANKDDSHWQREYKNPHHVSAATGGDGTICVYNGGAMPADMFAHEAGHNLAKMAWNSTQPPRDSEYGRAQAAEPPVSGYGANSPAEDFAEACRAYLVRGSAGPATDPPSAVNREELAARFPKKYAAVERVIAAFASGAAPPQFPDKGP